MLLLLYTVRFSYYDLRARLSPRFSFLSITNIYIYIYTCFDSRAFSPSHSFLQRYIILCTRARGCNSPRTAVVCIYVYIYMCGNGAAHAGSIKSLLGRVYGAGGLYGITDLSPFCGCRSAPAGLYTGYPPARASFADLHLRAARFFFFRLTEREREVARSSFFFFFIFRSLDHADALSFLDLFLRQLSGKRNHDSFRGLFRRLLCIAFAQRVSRLRLLQFRFRVHSSARHVAVGDRHSFIFCFSCLKPMPAIFSRQV